MHKLVILIEDLEDPAPFEAGWPEFLHWAEQMPGLRREVTSRVTRSLFGASRYAMVHELLFDDAPAAYQALESPAGQAAGRTLQALTGGRMSLFFADHLEDSLDNIRRTRGAAPDPELQGGPDA